MTRLWLDTETYCDVPIKRGLQPYLERVELMIVSWAFDDEPPEVIDLTAGETLPERVVAALNDPSVELWSHKSDFDRNTLGEEYPAVLDIDRWRCSLAQANAHSLPGRLELLCQIFQLDASEAKHADGKELVQLFCKPTKKGERNTRHTHPAEWAAFVAYAKGDIPAMRKVSQLCPTWNYPDNPDELALWRHDQRMNLHGVLIDVEFARAAVKAPEREKKRLAKATAEATDGEVQAATQRDALLAYILEEYDVELPDMRKATLERRLEDENLPDPVRALIALRLESSTTSVAKYKRALEVLGSGDRLKFIIQFCGALRTGRAAGRTFQPQNMPRPKHKQPVIEDTIAATKAGVLDLTTDEVMPRLSSSIRGLVIAPGGKKLVVADLSQIEGRKMSWLASEQWKLQAYADYDTPKLDERGQRIPDAKLGFVRVGADTYILAYSRSFGLLVAAVTDAQRQIGKVQELALQYQGAVGAFTAMLATIGMESLATEQEVADAYANPEVLRDSAIWPHDKHGEPIATPAPFDWQMSIHTAKVVRIVKAWRKAHPNITNYWYALERAAKHTVCTDEPTTVGKGAAAVTFDRVGTWLRCRLPSGRFLSYPAAAVINEKLSYMGVNPYSRQWQRLKTYGGKLCIAAGTPVLTDRGWLPVEAVTAAHCVWDGVEWVRTNGRVHNGRRPVIRAFGALLTPDHEVLTTGGWRRASQSEGHNRAACRLPDGYRVPRLGRPQVALAGDVRLRSNRSVAGDRAAEAEGTRNCSVLRLQTARKHRGAESNARHVGPSGVRSLVKHARALLSSLARGLEELRRSRYHGLPELARIVRDLLAGHGAVVYAGAYVGTQEQRGGVLAEQLRMGDAGRASAQPQAAEVYDLLDCGPRNRFVIATDSGEPLIVHNCENICQASSRDVFMRRFPAIEAAGYRIVLHAHDEVITEAPDSPEFNAETLSQILAAPQAWLPGLPLAAAGFEAYRYRKG